MKICIPIQAKTMVEALMKMHLAAPPGDILEIWVDHIADLNLKEIFAVKEKPLLIVNKPVRERGQFAGSEDHRLEVLKQAIDLGADYIDISLDTNLELIKDLIKFNNNRAKIIVSYHNFKNTPGEKELLELSNQAYKIGADIVKIATTAVSYKDNLKIFSIVKHFAGKNKPIIALCMADRGKISRVVAPLLGSYLMFAPLDGDNATAPGQLTVEELRAAWELLK